MCGKLDHTERAFVKNLVDSGKRTAKTPVKKKHAGKRTAKSPVKKKNTVTSDILIKLCSMFLNAKDLLRIRDFAMILLSFSRFIRFNELSQLRGNVKYCYLIIKIRKSKTVQYRDGDEVLISKGVSSACFYTMFLRYVDLANVDLSSDILLFRPLCRSKEKC